MIHVLQTTRQQAFLGYHVRVLLTRIYIKIIPKRFRHLFTSSKPVRVTGQGPARPGLADECSPGPGLGSRLADRVRLIF